MLSSSGFSRPSLLATGIIWSVLYYRVKQFFRRHEWYNPRIAVAPNNGKPPISIADFAVPEQRLAIYIDGAAFHVGQRLRRYNALRVELIHVSRLAALGELASGIAHEINQPLSVAATWTEVAMREIHDTITGDKQESLVTLMRIGSAIERSSDIIHQIKDFAQKSEPRVTTVSLADALPDNPIGWVFLMLSGTQKS